MFKFSKPVAIGAALVIAPLSIAAAQEIASAPPRGDYMVFVGDGNRLTPAAVDTVRAVADANQGTVRLKGQASQVQAVRAELVNAGTAASSIVIEPVRPAPLPRVADGLPDPAERRVEISF